MRVHKAWKVPRAVMGLFIVEFIFIIPALAIFGIAAPNTWRTALWKDGGLNEFNSDPNQILYAYANHRPIPKTPMVWNQFITNWNVAVSLLSMFTLLIEAILHVMRFFHPLLSLVVHVVLVGMWTVSVYGQAGPDRSDPQHPSSSPWYLTKSCSVAYAQRNVHYCQLAKSSFAVTVILLIIYVVHIPLAIHSLIGSSSFNRNERTDASIKSSPESYISSDKPWELSDVPPRTPVAPKTPATPRTQAFNTLSSRA